MARYLVRHPEATAELVVDEVADTAVPVAPEARFTIELGRSQRIGPKRSQDVTLPTGMAHQDVAFSSKSHRVPGPLRKSVLSHELVADPGLDKARELKCRHAGQECLGDASRETTAEPKARIVETLPHVADAHTQHS